MTRKYEDLTGRKFGGLSVIKFHEIKNKKTYWLCRCDCGNIKPIRSDGLKSGVGSCGCATIAAAQKYEDLSGNVFERLTVMTKHSERSSSGTLMWKCKCTCGKTVIISGNSLRSGHTKSCGCYHREKAKSQAAAMGKKNRTHGKTKSPEYYVWRGMLFRCNVASCSAYSNYGGRGIKVCERWNRFDNFYADMGDRPSPQHEIDRIDVNKDYTPDNCRWVTVKEQQRNRRSNVMITYEGRTQCIAAWAEERGMTTMQLWRRLRNKKWTIHEAMTVPVSRFNGARFREKYKHKTR